MKKILSLFLAAVFAVGMLAFSSPSASGEGMNFSDVGRDDWFYDYVKYVFENGYMVGVTAKKFDPEGNLTRGMFVTILCRLDGGTPSVTDKFVDVPSDEWYAPYVGWASSTGLVNGYPGGKFKPEANLSRQEMAAITDRYISYRGITMPRRFTAPAEFADSGKIEDWAKGNMENLRRAGIFNGDRAGKCNPNANITRAETATVVKNLLDARDLAWQGYDPLKDDGPVIIGARFLYENASEVRGTLGTDIDLTGEIPTLDAYYDSFKAGYTGDFFYPGYGGRNRMNSVGVSASAVRLDTDKYPVMKIAYKYSDYEEPAILEGSYQHNFEEEYGTGHKHRDPFEFVKGGKDGEFSTGTFDFSEKFAADTFDFEYDVLNLLVCPFDEDYRGVVDGLPNGKFKIAYIAFFPDQASADAFTLGTASPEIRDYIENYFIYTELFYEEADETVRKGYDDLLVNRISEILCSESEVAPADVEARGGKCFYISSFRGDDGNDGLTPDTPWKSISKLWDYKAKGVLRKTKVNAGDGVFFERGSIFYPERLGRSQIITLDVADGVTYGAYGEGPKPQFTHALDFGAVRSDENAAGTWLPTEWENVWLLDDDVGYWSADDGDRGEDGSCGNIVINRGEYVGVRLLSEKQTPSHSDVDPLFDGTSKTKNYGYMCNGKEWFVAGGTPLVNPGTALLHNLEYIHDPVEHKLYMYCDIGNPGEVFDDIKCSTDGYICYGCLTGVWESVLGDNSPNVEIPKGTRLDNISIMYSGTMGAMLSGDGLVFSNCEIGWCSGSVSSVESGKESNGSAINETVYNCYLHDIGDGPLSTQHGVDWTPGAKPQNFENIEYYDNVIISSGNAVESLCYNETMRDETGIYGKNKQINFHVHDNIFAYIGYGITEQQSDGAANPVRLYLDGETVAGGAHKGGEVFCSTGEKINCVIENNLIMYPCGAIWSTDVSTDAHRRGWIPRNNTYVCDNRYTIFISAEADVDHFVLNEPIKKFTNEQMPYNERYLSYFTAKGIDEGSKFYWYESDDRNLPFRGAFTDGYYIERGIKPAN